MQDKTEETYSLTTLDSGMVAVVRFLKDNLNYRTAETVRESLRDQLDDPSMTWTHLVLNMHDVRMLDSAAISLLMSLQAIAKKHDVSMCVCEIQQYVARIFAIMKVQQALTIYTTEAEAVRAAQSDWSGI